MKELAELLEESDPELRVLAFVELPAAARDADAAGALALLRLVERGLVDDISAVRVAALDALEALPSLLVPSPDWNGDGDPRPRRVDKWPSGVDTASVAALLARGLEDPDTVAVAAGVAAWLERRMIPALSPLRSLEAAAITTATEVSYHAVVDHVHTLGRAAPGAALAGLLTLRSRNESAHLQHIADALWARFPLAVWGLARGDRALSGSESVAILRSTVACPAALEERLVRAVQTRDRDLLQPAGGVLHALAGRTEGLAPALATALQHAVERADAPVVTPLLVTWIRVAGVEQAGTALATALSSSHDFERAIAAGLAATEPALTPRWRQELIGRALWDDARLVRERTLEALRTLAPHHAWADQLLRQHAP
jgi:hypothetical protein